PERCEQLRLPLMVSGTDGMRSTNFTLSIEAAEGVTTGISAHDRAHTIRTAVSPNTRPEDLSQPGHIFPLMGQPGGVLTRAGHTEAGCDLARLAGMEPAAVIVEILNEDGTMARRPDLVSFARGHGLKMCTIAQLIRYRLETEESVEQISEDQVETEFGPFRLVCFEDHVHRDVHLALVRGEVGAHDVPLVRVQLTDTLRDVVGVRAAQLGWPLRDAMARIAGEESGIIVILRRHELPRELVDSISLLSGRPVAPGDHRDGQESSVLRTYGIGAQILRALGVRRMRVLSAPKQMHGLSGFGLEVVDYINQ
ncbi:MAG TPA: 3,4-dihydroxy-2-butanone-4-phosphate synthase, partial [Gammaproteobacteria bacterium]|nr:3,4-dihydroxy-2-butanone-4-phosphate synthase [Gammaproteobacteria bacterium]